MALTTFLLLGLICTTVFGSTSDKLATTSGVDAENIELPSSFGCYRNCTTSNDHNKWFKAMTKLTQENVKGNLKEAPKWIRSYCKYTKRYYRCIAKCSDPGFGRALYWISELKNPFHWYKKLIESLSTDANETRQELKKCLKELDETSVGWNGSTIHPTNSTAGTKSGKPVSEISTNPATEPSTIHPANSTAESKPVSEISTKHATEPSTIHPANSTAGTKTGKPVSEISTSPATETSTIHPANSTAESKPVSGISTKHATEPSTIHPANSTAETKTGKPVPEVSTNPATEPSTIHPANSTAESKSVSDISTEHATEPSTIHPANSTAGTRPGKPVSKISTSPSTGPSVKYGTQNKGSCYLVTVMTALVLLFLYEVVY